MSTFASKFFSSLVDPQTYEHMSKDMSKYGEGHRANVVVVRPSKQNQPSMVKPVKRGETHDKIAIGEATESSREQMPTSDSPAMHPDIMSQASTDEMKTNYTRASLPIKRLVSLESQAAKAVQC